LSGVDKEVIIAVSDLHLGDPLSNEQGFMDFIKAYLKPNQREISHLVLLGDILDLWKKNNNEVIQKKNHIFDTLASLEFELHYLVGNHDFALADRHLELREDIAISKTLRLTDGNSKYRFIHGHQLNYWYASAFYEFFSEAMCNIANEGETSTVWEELNLNKDIPQDMVEKINALSHETRRQVETKLAGPLLGQQYTVEDSLHLESEILEDLVDLASFQTKNSTILLEEIDALSSKISRMSGRKLFNQNGVSSIISEIAKKYLAYWKQILQWSISKEYSIDFNEVFGQMKRIAGIFTVDLNPEEYLIHGHGHKVKVDQENKIADTGCWIGDGGSFISISGKYVESIRWLKG